MTYFNIDINADVGEGLGNEAELMPFLSSCSIACGGHAGDENTMRSTINLAQQFNVKIGAHPSFPDKDNFGRIPLDISDNELLFSLKEQLRLFNNMLKSQDGSLNHIKPHGALYNLAAIDMHIAKVVVDLIKHEAKGAKLYVPYGSVIARLALNSGIEIVFEAFADRNYNSDLTLVSRQYNDALITDPEYAFNHCKTIIKEGKVSCINGLKHKIEASTFCLHGDNQNALSILKFFHKNFPKEGIEIC